MKEGWEYIDFKDVFPIKMGKTPPRGDKSSWDEKKETHNKWVSIADISNNEGKIIEDTKEYISDSAAEKINKVSKGSLLMSFKLSIGRMAFAGDDLYTNEAIIAIPENDKYILRFMYYYLLSYDWLSLTEGNEKVKGATLNKSSIGKIQLPILSLSEQQSIVDYLDSAFAKIDAMKANAEKALNEAKALFQASLKEMLEPKEGWEEKKLGEMSEIQSGFAFKSTQFQKRGEFQVIRMGNVRPGIIRYNESPVFIDSVDENTIEKSLLKVGDMIITQTGSRNKRDYGFTVLIDKEKLLLNQRIARIRVVNTITNKYLLYYSWTDYFRDQYFANEGGTVGQGNVGIDAIRYAVISYPPLSEQQSIVETLDSLKSKVDKLQENYDKISQECDALKQAILRQVFE